MDSLKTLALDPAAKTGFAHSDGHRGVWYLARDSDRHPGERLARLRTHLIEAFESWGYARIAYEDASFGSHHEHVKALHNRLAGVIELTAQQLGVELFPVNPLTLKKFATGNGRAKKWQMMRAAKIQLGIDTQSDDVADAVWVLEASKHNLRPQQVQTRTRQIRKRSIPQLFK